MKKVCLFLVCAGMVFCLVAFSVPGLVAILIGALIYHYAQTPGKKGKGRKATPPPRDPIDIELDRMKARLGLTYMKKKP